MKYMSRPKIAAVKDIDIDIVGIFGQKYRYRINISKGDIDPRLLSRCVTRACIDYFWAAAGLVKSSIEKTGV